MLSKVSVSRRWVAISLLGAFAAGCSVAGPPIASSVPAVDSRAIAEGNGGRSSATGPSSHGWLSPEARRHRGFIYWGSFENSTIAIFSARGVNGRQLGQITTGVSTPEALFVDKLHNVYVANTGNNTITAYKRGQTSPFLTISNGVNYPNGLAVDADGTVYCSNNGTTKTITVYPKGQTSPSLTIPVSGAPVAVVTDASDNLYAILDSFSFGSEVWKFAPGSTQGKNLELNIGRNGASTLEVDKSGNLIVAEGGSPASIAYFPAGHKQSSKTISVTSGLPYELSLSADEKTLYASVRSSYGTQGATFIIQDVRYPNGTSLSDKLTTSAGDWPVAVSPDNALGG